MALCEAALSLYIFGDCLVLFDEWCNAVIGSIEAAFNAPSLEAPLIVVLRAVRYVNTDAYMNAALLLLCFHCCVVVAPLLLCAAPAWLAVPPAAPAPAAPPAAPPAAALPPPCCCWSVR